MSPIELVPKAALFAHDAERQRIWTDIRTQYTETMKVWAKMIAREGEYLDLLDRCYEIFLRLRQEGETVPSDNSHLVCDEACETLGFYLRTLRELETRPGGSLLAVLNGVPMIRFTDPLIPLVERVAGYIRTLVVTWPELAPRIPTEIADVVRTVRVTPGSYLRAMWNLFWSGIRHPWRETTIDLKTGRVLYRS